MRKRFIIGPGTPSVLLVAVLTVMSILALLAASSVRQELELAASSTDMRSAEYAAAAQAQREVSALDEILLDAANTVDEAQRNAYIRMHLPEGMRMEGSIVAFSLPVREGVTLDCELELTTDADGARYRWRTHALTAREG